MTAVTAVTLLALAVAQAQEQTPSTAPTQPDLAPQPPGAAQPAGEVITLEQALKLAAERNLDLKAAQARLRQADEFSVQAWSSYLPQVNAERPVHAERARVGDPEGTFDEGVREIRRGRRARGSRSFRWTSSPDKLDASQMIFSPALCFGIRAATKAEDVARLTIDNVRRDVIFGVAQAYYGVAALKAGGGGRGAAPRDRSAPGERRARPVPGRHHREGRAAARGDRSRPRGAGSAPRAELLRVGAHRARDPARSAGRLRGGRRRPSRGSRTRSASSSRRRSASASTSRRRAGTSTLQRASRDASYGRYFPNVGAFGLYQGQNAAGFSGAERPVGRRACGSRGPFSTAGCASREIREGNARIAEAEASAASAEARVSAQVRQSILDLESARANAAKAKEQRELAAENQRLVDVSYRAGAATAVEQADATAELRNAEIAFTTESLSAQLAAVRLLQVAGEFDPFRRTPRPAEPAPAEGQAQ